MILQHNFSLRNYNTFHIEASTTHFVAIHNQTDLELFFQKYKPEPQKILLLGGGSNILFVHDFDGWVIKLNQKGIQRIDEDEKNIIVEVQAGENWHEFVQWSLAHDYGGLENLALIPGQVGTAPVQNIGAYGIEVKDCIHEVIIYDWINNEIKLLDNTACAFSYRNSIFKQQFKNQYIILSVRFILQKKPYHKLNLNYGDIQTELQKVGGRPTIQKISQAVIKIRQSKLPDPKILGNSGSFFKNPIISKKDFEHLQSSYPALKMFPIDDYQVKLSAAWLIEQCGWKGKRIGDAGVHDKQALVLVNHGNATGENIYELSSKIIQDVSQKFNIQLEREVNIIMNH